MIPVIASGLISIVGKFFTDKLLYYVAIKALIIVALTVTLPIIIKNLIHWFFNVLHNATTSALPSGEIGSFMIEFSGVGGYFAQQLRLADAVSILLTAVTIRLTLNMIPFVK